MCVSVKIWKLRVEYNAIFCLKFKSVLNNNLFTSQFDFVKLIFANYKISTVDNFMTRLNETKYIQVSFKGKYMQLL